MISIAIFCSSKSNRFGGNKPFYTLDGKPFYQILLKKLKALTDDLFLQTTPDLEPRFPNACKDLVIGKGPLGGIYSALHHAKYNKVFVVASDMPYLDVNIVKELKRYTKYDIIVPKWTDGYLEPLCAIYSKPLLSSIRHMIENKELKISKLYDLIPNIKYVNINKLIAEGKIRNDCFINVNWKKDLLHR
jgi:molybdopterin-guanine dinucleotide biosynthesis protein A